MKLLKAAALFGGTFVLWNMTLLLAFARFPSGIFRIELARIAVDLVVTAILCAGAFAVGVRMRGVNQMHSPIRVVLFGLLPSIVGNGAKSLLGPASALTTMVVGIVVLLSFSFIVGWTKKTVRPASNS